MATATWVREILEHEGVEFEESYHQEAYTAQSVAQGEHISGHRVAKVVVVIADRRPVELVLPASRQVVMEEVRTLLNAQNVRLATENELSRFFTDCETGAIPALRHWPGVEVWMDESMHVDGDILFQAGTHCDAVRMHFDDWFQLVKPEIGAFTQSANVNRPEEEERKWEHGGQE
jgi:Ala-tRNA(Pro) deacylase